MPQFVRLTNRDSKPFSFMLNNEKRVIAPDADTMVPWNVACSLFGNPGVLDVHPQNARAALYKKVCGFHGFQNGFMNEEDWEQIRPKIEVYDVETNERIFMVIEDPDGMNRPDFGPAAASNVNELASLQSQVAALTSQIAKMTQAMASQLPPTASGGSNSPTATADSHDEPAHVSNHIGELNIVSDIEPNEDVPTMVPAASADDAAPDAPPALALPPRPTRAKAK